MAEIKFGFTGTRIGMTGPQSSALAKILAEHRGGYFNHGDCIGADAQAHDLAYMYFYRIGIHPSDIPTMRAGCFGGHVYPEKKPLERNKDIVDASDRLLAAPRGFSEELRSGTWSAIRYALKTNKPVTIIWPDGKVEEDYMKPEANDMEQATTKRSGRTSSRLSSSTGESQ